jgi:hypothetical protein
MRASSTIIPFPQSGAEVWIDGYHQAKLAQKDAATVDAYLRVLRQFTAWVVECPGHGSHFEPDQLTTTVVELYLSSLKEQGHSDDSSLYPGEPCPGQREVTSAQRVR